jgi:hypothetical protein
VINVCLGTAAVSAILLARGEALAGMLTLEVAFSPVFLRA